MKEYITSKDGTNTRLAIDYPNKCPICKNNILPNNKMEYVNNELKTVDILFSCPACGMGFLSHYKFDGQSEIHITSKYLITKFVDSYPEIPDEIIFDNYIKNMSPKFCEIFNQSNEAEFYKLTEIAGMGYRKSLEFLIKDFCSKNNPEETEKIKKMNLSQVIDNYVESDKIKKLSKASTWIGNDETHYIKVWDDKNIDDLKKFIKSIVAFITYDISVEEASEMLESK